ncbi:MAG: multicopper oxidase domain-containing protein [Chitinophagaceae bacterium]|nr:multicopper oxidase domain-containing protein [Oligoflexus sp.]
MRSYLIPVLFLAVSGSACRHGNSSPPPLDPIVAPQTGPAVPRNPPNVLEQAAARVKVVTNRENHNAKIREAWNAMTGFANIPKDPSWDAVSHGCKREAPGASYRESPHLVSKDGVLSVALSYQTSVGEDGNVRFCYITPDGEQDPSLHVRPGDHLKIALRNDTPVTQSASTMAMEMSHTSGSACGSRSMTDATTNLHFHGTNARPVCHEDEVLKTMINPGTVFNYDLTIPVDEPPGLYWYHPHVHGLSEAAVQGGATGALIVDGIERVIPETIGMIQRTMMFRDQLLPKTIAQSDKTPGWDVSLNGIPILFPDYNAPTLEMIPGRSEIWRLVNAAADAMFDVQLVYDGVPQPFQVVSLDAVPINSQNATRRGTSITMSNYVMAPGSRIEFIVTPPNSSVKKAQLISRAVDTGPGGDLDPERPLLNISMKESDTRPFPPVAALAPELALPQNAESYPKLRFEGLDQTPPSAQRKIYFSSAETGTDTNFFIVVDGQEPAVFNAHLPPSITTTQGLTEEWTIENRTDELHTFHIHQIHFLVLEINGVPVSPSEAQYRDVINVPYWSGTGPYPSVKLRMDFRGPYVGDFVYHCHILEHEDKGMMAIIRVNPQM